MNDPPELKNVAKLPATESVAPSAPGWVGVARSRGTPWVVYVGFGTLVVILVIVLITYFIRRA